MKLYLVRHAKAVSKYEDPARPLSQVGSDELTKMVEFIKPRKLCIEYLWHSSKLRAVQTAEAIADVISITGEKSERSGLHPNDSVASIRRDVEACTSDCMIVGHLPFLSVLVSDLVCGKQALDVVAFRTAGIVCLSRFDTKYWSIEWMVTSDLF